MKYLKVIIVVLALLTAISQSDANVVASGQCSNGRVWWMNIEVNNDGSAGCIMGMNCNGQTYSRNCNGGNGNGGGGVVTTITANTNGNDIAISVSNSSNIQVYNVVTGALIYTHPSTLSSGVVTTISTSTTWGSGAFVIVAIDPSGNEATGALVVTL